MWLETSLKLEPGNCLFIWNSSNIIKSAHTALAVKACLLGCKTATLNAQVTFVNIAVAIPALAGGGATQKISHRALPELVFSYLLADSWVLRSKRVLRLNIGSFWRVLRYIEMEFWVVLEGIGVELKSTEPFLSWCFRIFWPIFGCCGLKGYWDGILGRFGGSWDILRCNYWIVLEGIGVEFLNRFGWCLAVFSTIWPKTVLLLLADWPKTTAVWAATPREAGWIISNSHQIVAKCCKSTVDLLQNSAAVFIQEAAWEMCLDYLTACLRLRRFQLGDEETRHEFPGHLPSASLLHLFSNVLDRSSAA